MKMKNSVSAIIITTVTMIVVITITFCCEDCCTRYAVFTEPLNHPNNCNCDISLNQLLENKVIVKGGFNCSRIEVQFKSGIYSVNNSYDQRGSFRLVFTNTTSIIIKGQQNGTFKCFKGLKIVLQDIVNIDMKDMHTLNCHFFVKILYPIIATNTEIVDSIFTNTDFTFQYFDDIDIETDANCIMVVTMRNTTVNSCCSLRKAIISMEDMSEINITLQNFIMSDNNSTLFDLLVEHKTSIIFAGKNYFVNNTEIIIDSGELPDKPLFNFKESEVYIINNRVNDGKSDDGSPIRLIGATALFWHSHVVFNNNDGSLCGGIFADDLTEMIFASNSTLLFTNNRGTKGGALSMQQGATLTFNATKLGVALHFTDNSAQRGGAIYVEDWRLIGSMFNLQCDASLVKLTFRNNSALLGGNQIYGGWVDWFTDGRGMVGYNRDITKGILNFETVTDSDVASDPVRICLCKDSYPNCGITNYSIEIYGHAANLNLVAVGQRFTGVPAHIKASPLYVGRFEKDPRLHLWPDIQSLSATCTNVTYIIYHEK